MSDILLEHLQKKVAFDPDQQETILEKFKPLDIAKGEVLLQEGGYCRKIYFIESGAARTYALIGHRDVTSWFYPEHYFLSSWYSFLQQQPAHEYIEVLEDSRMHAISYTDLIQLYDRIPQFERFGRFLMEEQLAFIDYFSKGYLFLTAKERYDLLMEYFPQIILRVKLGHIASFLGISQETLSRIRSGKGK